MTKKAFLISLLFLAAGPALAVEITNVVPDIANSQGTGGAGNVVGWIQAFYQFSLIAGVFLAVGVITWAGLKYALAAGNPSGQSDARDQILQALLGLILLFGAYIVLFTINPNLTKLSLPTLSDARVGTPAALTGGGGSTGSGGGCSGGCGAGNGIAYCTRTVDGGIVQYGSLAACNRWCVSTGVGTCSQTAPPGGLGNTDTGPGGP